MSHDPMQVACMQVLSGVQSSDVNARYYTRLLAVCSVMN